MRLDNRMPEEHPHRPPLPPSLTWEATLAPHEVRITVRDGSQGVQLVVTGLQLAVRGILEPPRLQGSAPEPSTAVETAEQVIRMMPTMRPASGSGAAF